MGMHMSLGHNQGGYFNFGWWLGMVFDSCARAEVDDYLDLGAELLQSFGS